MSPLIKVPFVILLLWKHAVLGMLAEMFCSFTWGQGTNSRWMHSSASRALEVVFIVLPQMAWNEPHGILGPKYVPDSWAWWYYPDILALVSPFITLLSCFTACSISIIAIIRRWLTKWQRCRCNVSPSALNRTFLWATRRLEQSFVMTGLQGETSLPNFSRTRSNP